MSTGSLLLHPVDPGHTFPPERLTAWLHSIDLIGAALPGSKGAYQVGDHFLQLVTFMGCSPYLEINPPAPGSPDANSKAFCHILIHALDRPRLRTGINSRPPCCPSCGRQAVESLDGIVTGESVDIIECAHCGEPARLMDMKWRRDAGYSRFFIEIRNVFPGEAVPVDRLMSGLATLTGCDWRYFYLTADH